VVYGSTNCGWLARHLECVCAGGKRLSGRGLEAGLKIDDMSFLIMLNILDSAVRETIEAGESEGCYRNGRGICL
jgi:hypothetical protein